MSAGALHIRDATLADAEAIARVNIEAMRAEYAGIVGAEKLASLSVADYARRWRGWIGEGDRVCVALVRDALVGFACYGPEAGGRSPEVGELFAFYVEPRMQGRGAGSQLHDAAQRGMRAFGAREAVLWVIRENARARAFYEHRGWRAEGGERRDDGATGPVVTEVRYRIAL